ncbi:MAG: hypothetical protein Satyrvirus1_44 [Satyrvirus sp.]|uniref:Uncharacterized protein n=1 Tax=Satyrvirus sp. TaxID=2487771 RepID=A0A3G5ACJ4_9VIRU|nr:MAG: hypothetical protein Satyrvirus1_44 [Satyrvirus sp.]
MESDCIKYIRLNNGVDENGQVDFIANKTKLNYINLGGINLPDTIDCIHKFLCKNKVWVQDDTVIHTKKPINYIPEKYHNISFILEFYNNACLAKEIRERNEKYKEPVNDNMQNEPCNNICQQQQQHSMPQMVVKHLTNPNIYHGETKQNTAQKKR